MATVNKDFKIKQGLIVEGTTATVNGFDVLTKKTDDQSYIIGLIGGAAVSTATANTIVERDANGDFAAHVITADLVGDVTGNADTATTLATSRNIQLTGDVTGTVSFNGSANAVISTTLDASFATDAEVATAKAEAGVIAAGYAATAKSDAQTFATSAVAAEAALRVSGDSASVATASADATSKANAAQAAAASDATTKANAAQAAAIATASADATSKADAAEAAAASDASDKADAAEAAANLYTDTEIAALVDSAPALLDTLNELAAAIGDDANFASTLSTSVGTKVSKAGDTMTGLLVLSADPSANLGAATKQYVDTAQSDAEAYTDTEVATEASARATAVTAAIATASADATTKADAALDDANDYTDAEVATEASNRATAVTAAIATASADATSKANAAQSAAEAYADALDTDDVAEATSLYFTDARAKTSAAQLLTGATLTNITISGNGSGLTITAENGVADSTTSDLAEGSNLYFTDARARTAVDGTNRAFTSVAINSVAKQVAATLSAPTAGVQVAHAFAKADYRSAEYLVKIANGSHTEVSKVLLTLDSSDNIAITEYGIVGTNGSLATVSAGISGSNVQLQVTTANNNSTVTVMGTLLV